MPRFINILTFVASATASSSRSDDDVMSVCIAEEEGQRNRCRPATTLWAEGVAGNLCVPCRRRCSCIASSSLLDLPSQAPSANIIVFMERGTYHGIESRTQTARAKLNGFFEARKLLLSLLHGLSSLKSPLIKSSVCAKTTKSLH